MVGINDATGKWSDGFEHVVQSLRIIFSTPIGSRVMRRTFGSLVPAVLGRSLTPPTILRFKTAVIAATELWEPRFSIGLIYTDDGNSADKAAKGVATMSISGDYMPRGHLGDFTVASAKTIALGPSGTIAAP